MPSALEDRTRIVVGKVEDIVPGSTKKFVFVRRGQEIEAFVLIHNGELHAYLNRCRHLPMTMDWVDNQFFTEEGDYIQCATHGACYLPDTGECIAGPPVGKSLIRVPLEIEDGEIVATLPPD